MLVQWIGTIKTKLMELSRKPAEGEETSPSKSQLWAGWNQFREELVSLGQEK